MKSCFACKAVNADNSKFCQYCGKTLLDAVPQGAHGVAAQPTVALQAEDLASFRTRTRSTTRADQQDFDLKAKFHGKDLLLIGRALDCDLFLPHPSVSRYHARLERAPVGVRIVDLNSDNGVWVGGRRIKGSALLQEGDRIGIGPFLMTLKGGVLSTIDNSQGLRLEARHLEKVICLPGGGTRKLLDNINLVINPGEFVTLLGPSGSGKSTLMDCLNGRRRATGGKVLANGEDFYKHFNSFRQSLGYVPQKDIVHTELTVSRALYYTACLRLPQDTPRDELLNRLESVIQAMELGPHRDTRVGNLSGGQIKRVSLGAELIAQPSLLYIDEATSGLDAGTEARMMRLFRELAEEGRSIICITHNVEHVDECHLVLVLARGKVVFYGPPAEAPRYFKVKRISDIYDRISERELADWERDFHECSLFREFVLERLAPGADRQPLAPATQGPVRAPTAIATPQDADEGSDGPVPAPFSTGAAGFAREDPFQEESGSSSDPALAAIPGIPQAFVESPMGQRLNRLLEEGRKLIESSKLPLLGDQFRALKGGYLRLRRVTTAVSEAFYQFQLLTARYAELMWGDRRSLRLLFLQAPLVAVFLLVGFLSKNFVEPMPRLRDLTDEERRMLTVLEGLNELLDEDHELTPEEGRTLQAIQFKAEVAGLPAVMDGTQVVKFLRHFLRSDLSPEQKQTLEQARFTFVTPDSEQTITGWELARVLRQFRETRIPEHLLRVPGPVVPRGEMQNPRYTYILLFILVVVVLWFGCNNAAKEIVKEEAIYARERTVNLGILPYLASKFLVLTTMTVAQALILMLLLYGPLELLAHLNPSQTVPSPDHMLAYPAQFGMLVLLSVTGVALGLLLSACVSNPDRANALLPYVLIPQIILGGGVLSVESGALSWLAATLSPVYWAYRAVHRGAWDLPTNFPGYASYPDHLGWPIFALSVQTILLLLLTVWSLRQKDVCGK